jgi:hypothetical protein
MSKITDLYEKAFAAFKRGDAAQWEAADAMAELYALGEPQRAIAKKLGCGQATVTRYIATVRDSPRITNRPPFSEAYARANPSNAPGHHATVPKTPEAKAQLVADLLKDKAVADAPIVQQVQKANTTRQLRAEVADFNKAHGIPTRTTTDREERRTSTLSNDMFWHQLESDIGIATTRLNEAARQVEATGLPRSAGGGLIRKARALVKAAERFEEAATNAGVGQPMANGAVP